MPLRTDTKRRTAMEIVFAEERARGCVAELPGSWAKEKEHGCDILSTPPGADRPHPVEVKAWGEPLLTAKGRFAYDQDIRASQLAAAQLSDMYRLEIVGNLDAYLAGAGPYERLTLSAHEIRERAVPRLFDLRLDGLQEQIRTVDPPPATSDQP
jgi:hypothetical protein